MKQREGAFKKIHHTHNVPGSPIDDCSVHLNEGVGPTAKQAAWESGNSQRSHS
jgi:hypothetical protein